MSNKPEDRPKLIGLLVAIVGVVAYVLITLVPKLTGAQTAPPTAPPALTTASASAPGGPAPNGQTAAAAPLPDGEADQVPPAPAHDSFTPPASDTTHPLPAPQTPQAVRATAPMPVSVTLKPAAASAPVVTPVAPALPPVELKGVILGEPSIAVLSVNNEVVQRQVGDQIAGGLKLVKIEEAGIVLQEGKKQIAILVGHSMPTPAPQALAASTPAPQPGKP